MIKLQASEVIACPTSTHVTLVLRLLNFLSGGWMSPPPLAPTYINPHDHSASVQPPRYHTPIPATQWLNRHRVFVPHQRVKLISANEKVTFFVGPSIFDQAEAVIEHQRYVRRVPRRLLIGLDSNGERWPPPTPTRVTIDWARVWGTATPDPVEYTPSQAREIINQIQAQGD